MTIDRYENLPAIVSELQDGAFQITVNNTEPSVLILGTAEKGTAEKPIQADKAQEAELRFGTAGTLLRGLFESAAGGARNNYLMRIGPKSAILYGVGSDDLVANPTSIETILKDSEAADLYFVQYTAPGVNEEVGRLIIKVANTADVTQPGEVVFDNNPGGQGIDLGHVAVSGEFTGSTSISTFKTLRAIALDKVAAVDTFAATTPAPAGYALSHTPNAGSVKVTVDGVEIAQSAFTLVGSALTLATASELEVVVSYDYDNNTAANLRDGSDGINLSRMELFEALDRAYSLIETEEFKFIVPMGAELDAPNITDGHTVILSTDARLPAGQRYPVAESKGDVLGKLFIEEFEGEKFYFWSTDVNSAVAAIWPNIGLASSTTKIDGSPLTASDFKEVNFGYQLANACFVSSVNEYSVTGVIGTSLPESFSLKDVSKWIGKEPTLDADGNIAVNGTGLLGNKHMVGKIGYKPGFFATDEGFLPVGGAASGSVLKDRGGRAIDIGRHISVYSHPQSFFNPSDATGFGYTANGAAYYAGFCSSLQVQSAPTNKVAPNADTLVKLPKAKLDSLAKYHYIALKQKNRVFRFSDAPTAARPDSDYRRLSTIRVLDRVIDIVREIAQPYIGEPNTFASRLSLETNIKAALAMEQKLNVIQRFDVKLSATAQQRIEGNATIELVIVPPFEMKKIEVITSLAKE